MKPTIQDGPRGSVRDRLARNLRHQLVSQFHRPHGLLGHAAGVVLARRPSNRRRNLWTVELLQLEPDHRVLELGFGPGVAIQACADRTTRGEVVGIDHSETMQAVATRRNRRAVREGRVRLETASFDALPDLDEPFDRIFAVNAAFFSDDQDALLSRLVAALRPGGRLALTFQSRRPGATTQDSEHAGREISAAFERASLTQVRMEILALEPVAAVCVLGERSHALDKGA